MQRIQWDCPRCGGKAWAISLPSPQKRAPGAPVPTDIEDVCVAEGYEVQSQAPRTEDGPPRHVHPAIEARAK